MDLKRLRSQALSRPIRRSDPSGPRDDLTWVWLTPYAARVLLTIDLDDVDYDPPAAEWHLSLTLWTAPSRTGHRLVFTPGDKPEIVRLTELSPWIQRRLENLAALILRGIGEGNVVRELSHDDRCVHYFRPASLADLLEVH